MPERLMAMAMAMGCRQCLPLSVVQLKGKHCRKPHCRNGIVDTFELNPITTMGFWAMFIFQLDNTKR